MATTKSSETTTQSVETTTVGETCEYPMTFENVQSITDATEKTVPAPIDGANTYTISKDDTDKAVTFTVSSTSDVHIAGVEVRATTKSQVTVTVIDIAGSAVSVFKM